jgi:MtN3 and saliva related transmembrane protein
MDALTLLGLGAGALTSLSFVPQVRQAWRTKRLDDVNPWTMGALTLGLLLWATYGVLRQDIAIILTNLVGLTLTGTVLALWWRYARPRA